MSCEILNRGKCPPTNLRTVQSHLSATTGIELTLVEIRKDVCNGRDDQQREKDCPFLQRAPVAK